MPRIKIPLRFLEFCTPFSPPERWCDFRPESRIFAPPMFGTYTLAQLEEEFLEAELRDSGLVCDECHGLVMHPALSWSQSAAVMEMKTRDGDVILKTLPSLSSAGTLSAGYIFAGGPPRPSPLDTESPLLVTFDTANLQLLQNLGLPAVGLENLTPEAARQFVRLAAGCNPQESKATANSSERTTTLTLLFVGSSLATLNPDPPPGFEPLASWLLNAEEILQWDLSRVRVWLPSDDDRRRLEFCLQADDSEALRTNLLESLETAQFHLAAATVKSTETASVSTFWEAFVRHSRLIEREAQGLKIERDARADLMRAIDVELIEPLLELAEGERPLAKNQLTLAALVARGIHRRLVDDEMISANGPVRREQRQRRDASAKTIVRMVHQFRVLCAELRR